MALIYRATIKPTKLELIGRWLSTQPWYAAGGAAPEPSSIGAYRFDDPAGDVGIETHLVRVGDGPVLQVPLTYRGAELAGAEPALVGMMEHSVLGQRWVYDGCDDPVYASVLAQAVFGGGEQAVEHVDGSTETRKPSVVVQGSGEPIEPVAYTAVESATDDDRTVCTVADAVLDVIRVVDVSAPPGEHALTGTWHGQAEPALLATGRRR